MKRNRVRLTESQLHRVIKESVKRVLRENQFSNECILIVNGTKCKIEAGHTLDEWKSTYGYEEGWGGNAHWDASLEDLVSGAIEPISSVYWVINGRLYETD